MMNMKSRNQYLETLIRERGYLLKTKAAIMDKGQQRTFDRLEQPRKNNGIKRSFKREKNKN